MTQTTAQFTRINLLGGPMDVVRRSEILEFITATVNQRRGAIIANQNLHSLYLSRTDPQLRAFYDKADVIEIDSMPLIHWGRLLGIPVTREHRATYLDWREDFWALAAGRGWRVFFVGGAPKVAAEASRRLAERWPGVTIGVRHGYFDRAPGSKENQRVIDAIKIFRPDVLLVGMGMPIQETWILDNLASLRSTVILPVGAAFDYEAGVQQAAPRIFGDLCLEWLYRLVRQPRRLFRRYLVEPWSLLAPLAADVQTYVLRKAPAR